MSTATKQNEAMSPRSPNPPNDATYAGRLGASVKARRTAIGMTVAKLADAVGVSEATIYDWEKGRRTLDINFLPTIAVTLKTTIAKLMPAS